MKSIYIIADRIAISSKLFSAKIILHFSTPYIASVPNTPQKEPQDKDFPTSEWTGS